MANIEIATKTINSESALEVVAKHRSLVETILTDYVVNDGMETEIKAALDTLHADMDEIADVEEDEDLTFDQLVDKLGDLGTYDIEADKLLALCDTDDIIKHLQEAKPDFISVRIESRDDQDKLRHFLETEIYPNLNEQSKNILF